MSGNVGKGTKIELVSPISFCSLLSRWLLSVCCSALPPSGRRLPACSPMPLHARSRSLALESFKSRALARMMSERGDNACSLSAVQSRTLHRSASITAQRARRKEPHRSVSSPSPLPSPQCYNPGQFQQVDCQCHCTSISCHFVSKAEVVAPMATNATCSCSH